MQRTKQNNRPENAWSGGRGWLAQVDWLGKVSEVVAFEQEVDEEKELLGKDLREGHFCQKKVCAKVLR